MSINLMPKEIEYGSCDVLSSDNEQKIFSLLIEQVIIRHIEILPENNAKKLYLDTPHLMQRPDAEKVLEQKIRDLDAEGMSLYAKLLTIQNSCKSASAIIAISNSANARKTSNLEQMIGDMRSKGVTSSQLQRILGSVTHWKTGTPHPTQHLSEESKLLYRDLLGIALLPATERFIKAEEVIKEMLNCQMTRSYRMNVREETQSDRIQAKLHRQALRKTFRAMSASLGKYYLNDVPNLLSAKIRMTLRYHTWFGGGDADGKPNADSRALLEGMVGYTLDAIEEHHNDIQKATKLQTELVGRFKNIITSLKAVLNRLTTLEQKLKDDSDDTGFDVLKQEFAATYNGLSIDYGMNDDLSVNSEKEFYVKLTNDLRHAVDNFAIGEAKQILAENLFTMRQYKNTFTTAKIEKRANGLIDIEIMNKLFGDKQFQSLFLQGPKARALANKAFTALSKDEQREMMRHVGSQAEHNRELLISHYRRIFPEGLDDKGFPNQLRERGERLILRAISPDKFGMDIVAEAREMSAEYAYFLGEELFGVSIMMHTMLNEDLDSLERAPDFIIDFSEHGGLASIMNAVASSPRLEQYLHRHGAMLPCSDSVKQLGPGAFFLQAQAINLIMKFVVQNNKTVCIKWGNGQTLTRGGGNAHVPGRLKAQALQWHLNGRILNIDDQDDVSILANVLFSSNTEQGRAADFMSPNATNISKMHQKMIGEMLGRSLELMGLVQRGTYIPQVAKFSFGVRRVFSSIAKDIMMRGYENFRDAVDRNGNRISDEVAERCSNMRIAGDANQAARPDSKAIESKDVASEPELNIIKKQKPLYHLRAIGTTIAISHMRSFHDGWFSFGEGLQFVHKSRLEGELGDGDLKVFLDDALWGSMIKNGLRTASMSDLPYVFTKLGEESLSHSQAMELGKSVYVDHMLSPPLLKFSGEDEGGRAELAYVAKLYYDQALFITYTECLSEIKLKGTPFPQTLDEIEGLAVTHLDNSEDKIGRFRLGNYTNTLFPYVDQDANGNRLMSLSSQILCDIAERRYSELSQQQRYAITASQRSSVQVFNAVDSFTDQDAYGSTSPPNFKNDIQ